MCLLFVLFDFFCFFLRELLSSSRVLASVRISSRDSRSLLIFLSRYLCLLLYCLFFY